MKDLFVPFPLALLARTKEFAEPCLAIYSLLDPEQDAQLHKHPENCINGASIHPAAITAPLYQQLVDWFREKHNVLIWVRPASHSRALFTYHVDGKNDIIINRIDVAPEYYEALTAALTEAFKLI